jgi:hypothetical protein
MKMVDKLADLKFDFSDLPKLDLSKYEIKTNELTQRGGYKGGAVLPSKNSINQQIRNYNAKQVTILTEIHNVLKNGGLI